MAVNHHQMLLGLLITCLLVACGGGQEAGREQLTPEALMQQQTGLSALYADTAASLLDTRPPIDKRNTPYLFPREHPDLPEHIADWLDERGYVIPQLKPITPMDNFGPSNVVSGELNVKGQKDWAVYCTDRKKTCIFVFWNASVDSFDIIDKQPTSIGYRHHFSKSDLWCCSYHISVADSSYITRMYDLFGYPDDQELPPIVHDGIDYGIYESGTYVFYYYNNKWQVLPGAD
ncbi:MAG: hypothetical protein FVQ81_08195 [Candidatus Glassbacteria bacterium]|nr:hypothetical protein [Candidatus Glassbacteria bacterium]